MFKSLFMINIKKNDIMKGRKRAVHALMSFFIQILQMLHSISMSENSKKTSATESFFKKIVCWLLITNAITPRK